jgi:metal-responsive CopG/Arc/MetJ family transcriptional regulator
MGHKIIAEGIMGYSRLSITVPDELVEELKALAKKKKIKLSHLVTDAIREKNNRLKEEAFVQQMNKCFSNQEVREEQSRIAEDIARTTDLEELPW